jgi:hypothetical protein
MAYGWCSDSARQGLALPLVQLIPIAHQSQRSRGGIMPPQQPGEVSSREAQRVLDVWPSKEGGIVGMGTAVVAPVGHQQPQEAWRGGRDAAVSTLDPRYCCMIEWHKRSTKATPRARRVRRARASPALWTGHRHLSAHQPLGTAGRKFTRQPFGPDRCFEYNSTVPASRRTP